MIWGQHNGIFKTECVDIRSKLITLVVVNVPVNGQVNVA